MLSTVAANGSWANTVDNGGTSPTVARGNVKFEVHGSRRCHGILEFRVYSSSVRVYLSSVRDLLKEYIYKKAYLKVPWDSDMSVATGTQKRMSALVVSFLTF